MPSVLEYLKYRDQVTKSDQKSTVMSCMDISFLHNLDMIYECMMWNYCNALSYASSSLGFSPLLYCNTPIYIVKPFIKINMYFTL
jgi:hypothetical protein